MVNNICTVRQRRAMISALATAIAAILCAMNLLFFFSLVVLVVAAAANVAASLQFQSALPINAGSAIACTVLNAVATPWLVAVIAAVVDFTKWPIRYAWLRRSLMQMFLGGRCCGDTVGTSAAKKVNHQFDDTDECAGTCCLSKNARRVMVYSAPFTIYVLSALVGVYSSADIGTAMYLILGFALLIFLCFFRATMEWRTIESSSFIFALTIRGWFPIISICANVITLTSVVIHDRDVIVGGEGSIALVYIFSIIYGIGHYLIKSHDDSVAAQHGGRRVFESRSLRTIVVAVAEIISLLIAGILIAVSYTPADNCIGVFMLLLIVVLAYAAMMFRSERVELTVDVDLDGDLHNEEDGEAELAVSLVNQQEQESGATSSKYQAVTSADHEQTTQSMFRYEQTLPAAVAEQQHQQQPHDVISARSSSVEKNNSQSTSHSSMTAASSINADDPGAAGGGGGGGGGGDALVSRCSDLNFIPTTGMDDDDYHSDQQQHNANRSAIGGATAAGSAKFQMRAGRGGSSSGNDEGDKEAALQRTRSRRIALFIMTIAITVVMISSMIDTAGNNQPCVDPGRYPGRTDPATRYGVCSMQFGKTNFTIADFTAFCAASYFSHENLDKALEIWWPGENATKVGSERSYGSSVSVHFSSIIFPQRSVAIVLVRGSTTRVDWMMDAITSSDAVAVQIGTAMLPVFFTARLKAVIVNLLSRATKLGSSMYYDTVAAEVRRLRSVYPNVTVYLTAHSLGGHVVEVVGALMVAPTIAVSPFGTGMQYLRRGFSLETANEAIQAALIPRGDLVPKVDEQLGFQQEFTQLEPCDESVTYATANNATQYCRSPCGGKNAMCHSIAFSMRSVAVVCGDPLGRYLVKASQTCKV